MFNLRRRPRNLELGLGLVNPSRSSFNTFLLRTGILFPVTLIVAPVYNLSPFGKCLVLPHDANNMQLLNKIIENFFSSIIILKPDQRLFSVTRIFLRRNSSPTLS